MEAQRYRHRIAIQEKSEVQDPDTGDISFEWTPLQLNKAPLNDVPAEVLTGPGREFIAANARQAETTARINLRWFPGLKETHRIVWDGRYFEIISIELDATARREYRLRCKDFDPDAA